ncbi:hypothetical protein AVEN_220541-1 [Araneus ventricosus]|uniref:Uncharacterized protein n=1 Tax=Araneus ventricosus TaxID=182803 RepID=A0A4Y2VKM4_ARAVE|nr:hypothetical protein AVEN_220541-1 [Araneus ventricosus]
MPRGFVGWLQHSGETSVNDWKFKGSGQRHFLWAVVDWECNLESEFDHPLFGWSNYDDSKPSTTGVEGSNMSCFIYVL